MCTGPNTPEPPTAPAICSSMTARRTTACVTDRIKTWLPELLLGPGVWRLPTTPRRVQHLLRRPTERSMRRDLLERRRLPVTEAGPAIHRQSGLHPGQPAVRRRVGAACGIS